MKSVGTLLLAAFTIAPGLPATRTPYLVPISNVRYDVTFDSATARTRTIEVSMSFNASSGDVLLSLPAWTPGSYEIDNFARYVFSFRAASGSDSLDWDKADQDTWRIRVKRAGPVTAAFNYTAFSLDNGNAWSTSNFTFFNGTNLFLYPEGQPLDFHSTVTVHTEPAWRVVTGMPPATGVNSFTASDYHDLVDFPFFVGRFDLDSTQAGGKPLRFAAYPAGSLNESARRGVLDQLARLVPPEAAVFGEIPWSTYTVFQVADSGFTIGSASGLEHQNSHLDIVSPIVLGNPGLGSLYAHEIFHAWNVKRLRPAEMTPYRYDRPQPTPLLWISEGITDYYADLAEVRSGVIDTDRFVIMTAGKINHVADAPPTALEDASLSAWIKPADGTEDIYYDQGSVAGLLLDILIRDASDNARSLDTVMRELYETTYKRGRGFTNEEWWSAVSRAANGKSFTDFARRYIDGRQPYPWDTVLPLGGFRLNVERTVQPGIGVALSDDENGRRVMDVAARSGAQAAGIKVGDYIVTIGGVSIGDPAFPTKFSDAHKTAVPGTLIPVVIRRGSEQLTLNVAGRFSALETRRLIIDPRASPKAVRVRDGILKGTTRS
ncbi:MAG TPA: PDZ domain-containing protein [Gemmatimonadaceae bacterium]